MRALLVLGVSLVVAKLVAEFARGVVLGRRAEREGGDGRFLAAQNRRAGVAWMGVAAPALVAVVLDAVGAAGGLVVLWLLLVSLLNGFRAGKRQGDSAPTLDDYTRAKFQEPPTPESHWRLSGEARPSDEQDR